MWRLVINNMFMNIGMVIIMKHIYELQMVGQTMLQDLFGVVAREIGIMFLFI